MAKNFRLVVLMFFTLLSLSFTLRADDYYDADEEVVRQGQFEDWYRIFKRGGHIMQKINGSIAPLKNSDETFLIRFDWAQAREEVKLNDISDKQYHTNENKKPIPFDKVKNDILSDVIKLFNDKSQTATLTRDNSGDIRYEIVVIPYVYEYRIYKYMKKDSFFMRLAGIVEFIDKDKNEIMSRMAFHYFWGNEFRSAEDITVGWNHIAAELAGALEKKIRKGK